MKRPAQSQQPRKFRTVVSKQNQAVAEAAHTGSLNGHVAEEVRARIAVLAFHLYEQRGRQDGHDVEDWLKAEQRILAGSS